MPGGVPQTAEDPQQINAGCPGGHGGKKEHDIMKTITPTQLENLFYRRKRMERKANQAALLVSGRGKSLLPLLRTPSGRYSEAQTRRLAAQLTDARPLAGVLDREFFESFLYCALRLAERGPSLIHGPGFEWSVDGNWQDLVDLAATVDPWGDRFDRWYQDHYDPASGSGTSFGFVLMDDLYETFTGRSIRADLEKALPEVVEKSAARYRTALEELASIQDENAHLLEDKWDGEYIPADAGISPEELDALDAAWGQKAREWEAAFPAKDLFCQTYLRCRERYFQTERCRGLFHALEQALDVYLHQAGNSYYLDDDVFFAAYGSLEQAAGAIRRAIKERG